MAFKGKAREQKSDFVREYYTGFATLRVVTVNPTRAELNKILGKDEASDEKEEFKYTKTDESGKEKLTVTFWLHNEENDKYFTQSFDRVYNEPRISKSGDKVQMINSVCKTTWVPLKVDKNGDITDEPDESLLPEYFTTFTSKEGEVLGKKKYRVAFRGEEEIANLLRAFISMDWYDPDTEVLIDTKKFFQENFKEIKDVIFDERMSKPFIGLLGVETSEKDVTKKYQKIYTGAYLPSSYMKFIKNGNKFNSYALGTWEKFTKDVADTYGFKCYHKLAPLSLYNEKADPVASNAGKPETAPADNEY